LEELSFFETLSQSLIGSFRGSRSDEPRRFPNNDIDVLKRRANTITRSSAQVQ
jgi:hypothetical protein